jgi:transcriptional regulator of arginine metabolism
MKSYRQAQILEIVEHEAVTSQEALRARLLARGIAATQATLSRDIRDLRLVKQAPDGAYRRADRLPSRAAAVSEDDVAQAVADYLRRYEVVAQMLVLRTDAGEAQPLAIELDRGQLAGVAGTIAGDDTILVICRTPEAAEALGGRLKSWLLGEATGTRATPGRSSSRREEVTSA